MNRMNSETADVSRIQDMERAARRAALSLSRPHIVLLKGPLGAGKTQMIRFMAKTLGADERDLCSPGFDFLQIYPLKERPAAFAETSSGSDAQAGRTDEAAPRSEGAAELYHWDLFRLKEEKALEKGLESIGFYESFDSPRLVFAEWGDILDKKNLPLAWPKLFISLQCMEGGKRQALFENASFPPLRRAANPCNNDNKTKPGRRL